MSNDSTRLTRFICWFSRVFFDVHDYPVSCGGDGLPSQARPASHKLARQLTEVAKELRLESGDEPDALLVFDEERSRLERAAAEKEPTPGHRGT